MNFKLVPNALKESASALQAQILQIDSELSKFEDSVEPIPELIDATNLLRLNEYLNAINEKRSQLDQVQKELDVFRNKLKSRSIPIRRIKKTPSKRTKKKSKRKHIILLTFLNNPFQVSNQRNLRLCETILMICIYFEKNLSNKNGFGPTITHNGKGLIGRVPKNVFFSKHVQR